MSERLFKGYGRAWTEERATGLARLSQILREPATKNTYYVLMAIFFVASALLLHLA